MPWLSVASCSLRLHREAAGLDAGIGLLSADDLGELSGVLLEKTGR